VIDWVNRKTSLGYCLATDAQGRGTMTTVVRTLVGYVFPPEQANPRVWAELAFACRERPG
jgi:RimJ/RimL family protein N-acetyltransferase